MTILSVSDSSHIWWVRTISWLPRQGEQVDWGSPEGMGGQQIKEVLMRYVWINSSELFWGLPARDEPAGLDESIARISYWILIIFMLYKMMCVMLSAIFLYTIYWWWTEVHNNLYICIYNAGVIVLLGWNWVARNIFGTGMLQLDPIRIKKVCTLAHVLAHLTPHFTLAHPAK